MNDLDIDIEPGFDALDRNGSKIGTVDDVAANYFVVPPRPNASSRNTPWGY